VTSILAQPALAFAILSSLDLAAARAAVADEIITTTGDRLTGTVL